MKAIAAAVAAACTWPWLADAAAIQPQSTPRVVSLDMHRDSRLSALERHRIVRRGGALEAGLDNQETLYFANATLGTPAQSVRLHLDTGSSDLWVNTPSSTLCSSSNASCLNAGTYTANSSSTYKYVGSWFNISYVDGSGATGDYATDTFSIGDATLTDFQFGIGYSSSATQGILGIGYTTNEVQVGRAGKPAYNNLPAALKASGLTSTAAYSLYLNDLDASTGSILFGGVDMEQYSGTLWTLPVEPEAGRYAEFLVTLTDVSLGSTVLGSDMALAVLLDSGSSLTYLPDDMVSQIYSMASAIYDEEEGVAFVPCSLADQTATLNFTFTSPTIEVAMDELVIDLLDASGQRLRFSNGVPACLFGIAPAGSGTNVLGDTFLRSAYVVYDLDNNEISLAQSKFNATASNIVEITSSGVPSASAVANPVTATSGIALSQGETGAAGASAATSLVWTMGIVAGAVLVELFVW